MSMNADARLPGFSLFLCEKIGQIRRAIGPVFLGDVANIYRSYVRSVLR